MQVVSAFTKNKYQVSLGGNIGTQYNLSNFKKKYVIIEASSFQLSHSKFIHPDYAFFINLTKDHLDWYGNLRKYSNSKLKFLHCKKKNNFAFINKKLKNFFIKKKF